MTTTDHAPSAPSPLVRELQDRRELEQKLMTAAERRAIRERAGASIRDVADALGVTYQTVWQWENRPPKRISRGHATAYRRLLAELVELADASDQVAA